MAASRTMNRCAGAVSGVLLSLLLGACDGAVSIAGPRAELERNRARWEATRLVDYRYAVRRSCFCPMEAIGPVRVTVSGDDVVARSYVDTGDPVPASVASSFPSVDGLFDVLSDALDRDAFRVEVTYEARTGLPLDIFIDYIENAVDEELGFSVTELPTSPPAP